MKGRSLNEFEQIRFELNKRGVTFLWMKILGIRFMR